MFFQRLWNLEKFAVELLLLITNQSLFHESLIKSWHCELWYCNDMNFNNNEEIYNFTFYTSVTICKKVTETVKRLSSSGKLWIHKKTQTKLIITWLKIILMLISLTNFYTLKRLYLYLSCHSWNFSSLLKIF